MVLTMHTTPLHGGDIAWLMQKTNNWNKWQDRDSDNNFSFVWPLYTEYFD